MSHRDHGAVRMGLERKPHPLTGGDETSHRTRSPVDQGPVEGRTLRFDERVGDDLRRLTNPGHGVLVQGESKGKARPTGPADSGEPESDESAVRDPSPAEILHGPLERAPDPFERRGDFRGPILVQCDSDSVVEDKASAPSDFSRSVGRMPGIRVPIQTRTESRVRRLRLTTYWLLAWPALEPGAFHRGQGNEPRF